MVNWKSKLFYVRFFRAFVNWKFSFFWYTWQVIEKWIFIMIRVGDFIGFLATFFIFDSKFLWLFVTFFILWENSIRNFWLLISFEIFTEAFGNSILKNVEGDEYLIISRRWYVMLLKLREFSRQWNWKIKNRSQNFTHN